MKILKFASLICLWFIAGYLVTGSMQDYEAGCPFDAGGNNASVPGTLNVTGVADFDDRVNFQSDQIYIRSTSQVIKDDIELSFGTSQDLSIGFDTSRDHLTIVNADDLGASKLFEITDSSAIFNVPLKRKRTEVALADLGTNTHYSVSATGSEFIVIYTSSPVVLDLPAVAGNDGLHYVIKKDSFTFFADVQSVTLDGNASETIDGAATNAEIDAWYDALGITCDGDEWFITERYIH